MSLSFVTYNVLAQAYAHADRYPNSPPEALRAGPRRALLLKRITDFDADVYLLQEVEADLFAALVSALPGHEGRYAPRGDGRPDGVALFVRRSAAALRDERTVRYVCEPQVALVARLEVGARSLWVASTHLRWQAPRTAPSAHIGRQQLAELIAAMPAGAPRIIGGDLNANSQSPVIVEAEASGFRLSCRTQRPWDTTNINGRRRKIDYLLYEPQALLPEPGTLPRLERRTPMPSMTEPSDHLPLWVRFSWR